ncbi:uncharacterized protein Z519_00428 [Cladophialophora bantiana CBS 173.52]|uniref:GED domain-containing protein n=1 Tax=Cladophialophora bantiana (strain ATCC 10958 / CBS 173.52 / CDC B-1940 / NIH 8579) TaxID=1442370 RepID=A0A0D2I665_CLAB1|nr:uncharacterized protein Z519_00428 [Cladophialophora bantiana CBS 173.52]KIW98765.1 hypothetical protein Z519_00428 [Cladophialophora bantiana CBS 173.52]
MDEVRDLIDEKQVALFDAIDRLSNLGVASDIEIPQLIVVGDQNSGKSSTLEAITRFQFPVHERVCTRFPIKLNLRKSTDQSTRLSIEPGLSRQDEDKKRLYQFTGSLSKLNELGDWMEKVAAALGVGPSTTSAEVRDQLPVGGNQKSFKGFTDDVFRVDICGPTMPLLSLVDLPGLFQAENDNQPEGSKQTVTSILQKYIGSKRNVILLVVSARTELARSGGLGAVQEIFKDDPKLRDRVVGVITNPDRPDQSLDEVLRVLCGHDSQIKLNVGWHVVRNQDKGERISGRLEERDSREKEFFRLPQWEKVPETQKGVGALRKTLKDMLWTHTQKEFPSLVSEVQEKIEKVKASLSDISRSRATDADRRKYLFEIAKTFEERTREASRGTYLDENREELHQIGEVWEARKGFFGQFGVDSVESQDSRLRASVRSLSKCFGSAMRELGKTKVMSDSSSTTDDVANESAEPSRQDEGTQTFPAQEVIHQYYAHTKPTAVNRKEYEAWLGIEIERWGGIQPAGEPNEVAYAGLFEYQSKKWRKIAKEHLRAVWHTIQRFIDLALGASGADEDVLQGLRKHLIEPRLAQLRKQSYGTMHALFECHGQGKTGFYDSFVEVRRRAGESRTQDLAMRLANFTKDYFGEDYLKEGGDRERLDKFIQEGIKILLPLLTGVPSAQGLFENVLVSKVTQALGFYEHGKGKETDETSIGHSQGQDTGEATARVIERVESYYEMSMLSFVGYFNSLVVETGILQKLPKALLTTELIISEDAETIEKIAGEREADAEKRQRVECELKILNDVLKTLKGYLVTKHR